MQRLPVPITSGFEQVDSLEQLATCRGPCVRRSAHVAYWRWDDDLGGTCFWGSPTVEDIEALVECWSIKLDQQRPARGSVFDVRRVTDTRPDVVEAVGRFVRGVGARLPLHITRQALIVPKEMPGFVVAGFASLHASRLGYPSQTFESLAEGLAWLGRDESLAGRLEALAEEVSAPTSDLERMRRWLGDRAVLPDASIAMAARDLGISERTLQRRLGDAGTTFRRELTTARITAARAMLERHPEKILAVAHEVGFTSEQHFAQVFRRHIGESPGQYRDRIHGRHAETALGTETLRSSAAKRPEPDGPRAKRAPL